MLHRKWRQPEQENDIMKDKVASKFAYAAVLFFISGMVFVILGVQDQFDGPPSPNIIGYVLSGLIFHMAMLPVISALPAPSWAKGSGYAWIVADNMLLMLTFYGNGMEIVPPLRWGVHLATATWIFGAGLNQQGVSRWLGFLAALGLTGASLSGAFDESAVQLLLRPAGLCLIVWLIMAGVRLGKSDAVAA
jgi:hypothetical protein